MQGLDIRLVCMFDAVARYRSFTRAAEELRIAQPWLSVQIRRLEDLLRFPLFERGRKQAVVLTPQAEAFWPSAQTFLRSRDVLMREVEQIRRQNMATLLLGAPEFSSDIVERPALLERFEARCPQIELEIITGHSPMLLGQLLNGDIDVTLALGPFPPDPRLEHMVLAETRVSMLVLRSHRLAACSHISLASLAGEEIANFRRRLNPPVYDQLAEYFADYGVRMVNFPEATIRGVMQFAANHVMPIVMPEWMIGVAGDWTDFILIPLEDPPVTLQLLAVRRVGPGSAAVDAFWSEALGGIADPGRVAREETVA